MSDANKNITSITYNYLNLPKVIQINGKGSIEYTYDDHGNKLKKQVVDLTQTPGKVINTLYIGSAVFQDDTLQLIGHEEGRLRYVKRDFTNGDNAYQFQYDYFLKDHLGNVRMVLTEQTDTAKYLASMEMAYRTKEEQLFYNIPQTTIAKSAITGYPNDPNPITTPNDLVAMVSGSGNKVGPAIVLKVMSGDKVEVGVKSFYKSGGSAGVYSSPVTDIITSLASGIVGIAGENKGTLSGLNGGGSPLIGAINSFRNGNNQDQSTKPKAYLNWILLDEQLKYVPEGSGADLVKSADAIQALGTPGTLTIPKNGFLYIYVSNETQNWDVFFDNLSLTHNTGPVIEETHYYPFGLTMSGISSKAMGKLENKFKFNDGNELQSKEFSDGSGLELYDATFRMYDPQIGRFHQIDPLAFITNRWSPYSFAFDNPISFNDPAGLTSDTLQPVVVTPPPAPKPSPVLGPIPLTPVSPAVINPTIPLNPGLISTVLRFPQFTTISMGVILSRVGTGARTLGPFIIPLLPDLILGQPTAPVLDLRYRIAPDIALPRQFIPKPIVPAVPYYDPELAKRMVEDLKKIVKKVIQNQGVVYALIATKDGYYNVYSSGSSKPTDTVFLKAGDVWKFGETTNLKERYDPAYFRAEGVAPVPLASGNVVQLKAREKLLIYGYFFLNGKLPPGNKIFR